MVTRNRREFLSSSALVGVWGAVVLSPVGRVLAAQAGVVTPRKKNGLFIAVDDLRPELGCYGHPMIKSPNIDALARSGVVFERTYCQQAVCGPTRASLLTGKRPDTTRIYDLKTHIRTTLPDVVTLQQHFKNNGYVSVGIGKLFHVGLEDEASYSIPHMNGKGGVYATQENLNLLKEGGKVSIEGGTDVETAGRQRMRARPTESADVPDDAYLDGMLANLAIEQLNRLAHKAKSAGEAEGQPFFLKYDPPQPVRF